MKTNQDLFEHLLALMLIILCIISGCTNGWIGIFRAIFGYIGILIFSGIILFASGNVDLYNEWKKQNLTYYNIFGKTIKWFSYGRTKTL